jgi:hypothetical protein
VKRREFITLLGSAGRGTEDRVRLDDDLCFEGARASKNFVNFDGVDLRRGGAERCNDLY